MRGAEKIVSWTATDERVGLPETRTGFIIANTGPGKGKTTAALGTTIRCVGRELKVLMVQFRRGSRHYGELSSMSH